MAYIRNNLVSRAGYSGVGGTTGDIGGFLKDVGSGALSFYGSQQQAVGAAAQSNRDLQTALLAQGGGIGMGTVAVVGGLGVVAYLLLRKKKPA